MKRALLPFETVEESGFFMQKEPRRFRHDTNMQFGVFGFLVEVIPHEFAPFLLYNMRMDSKYAGAVMSVCQAVAKMYYKHQCIDSWVYDWRIEFRTWKGALRDSLEWIENGPGAATRDALDLYCTHSGTGKETWMQTKLRHLQEEGLDKATEEVRGITIGVDRNDGESDAHWGMVIMPIINTGCFKTGCAVSEYIRFILPNPCKRWSGCMPRRWFRIASRYDILSLLVDQHWAYYSVYRKIHVQRPWHTLVYWAGPWNLYRQGHAHTRLCSTECITTIQDSDN